MILSSTDRQTERVSKPLILGAITASPGTARRLARSLLDEWGMADFTESVEVIVSELVTNAVIASMDHEIPPPVGVRLSATKQCVLIEVRDYDSRQPVVQQTDVRCENGRGLQLVASLSARWGWAEFLRGKVVWAEVRHDEF